MIRCELCNKECKSIPGLNLHKLYKHSDYIRPPLTEKQEDTRVEHIKQTYSKPETLERVSKATKIGMASTDLTERNKKISITNTGRVMLPESRLMMSESHKKLWKSEEYRGMMIESLSNKPQRPTISIEIECDYCGKLILRIPSSVRKYIHHFCSVKCHGKWISENMKGENNPSWKGGVSPSDKLIRTGQNMEKWRTQIYKRDGYTCQECGNMSSKSNPVILNAHHIKSFKDYPKLRFDVDNGVTLCVECHDKIHGKSKVVIEPELIWGLYWGNEYSQNKISKIYGCSQGTIKKLMIRFDIPRRKSREGMRLSMEQK